MERNTRQKITLSAQAFKTLFAQACELSASAFMTLLVQACLALCALVCFAVVAPLSAALAQGSDDADAKQNGADAKKDGAGAKQDEAEAGKEGADAGASGADQLEYGMTLAAADAVIADSEHWKIAYRIITPTTCEIACRLDESADYTLRFYKGECCYIEKIGKVEEAELKKIFDHYAELLGTTEEATESADKTYVFSRWKERDREVELSALRTMGSRYELTYLELDIRVDRLARQAQEAEIEALAKAAPAEPPAAP